MIDHDSGFEDALSDYNDATSDVFGSVATTFETNLNRWFQVLDSVDAFRITIGRLQDRVNFEEWHANATNNIGGLAGGNPITWPTDREDRLAMQFALFRFFSEKPSRYQLFHHIFFGGNVNFDQMVREITAQIFDPMARDLRKHIIRESHISKSDAIPASDRIVRLDHNVAEYGDAIDALDKVEKAVKESNDYDDAEDKEQRVAELSAGRQLLQARRVRIEALQSTIGAALKWLTEKFAAGIIGQVARRAWDALSALIGSGWHPF